MNDELYWQSYVIPSLYFKNTFHKYYGLSDTAIEMFWKKKRTCRNWSCGFGRDWESERAHKLPILPVFSSVQTTPVLTPHLLQRPVCS